MLKNLRFLAVLSCIEGIAAFIWLASIPAGSGSFSPIRLASLIGILLISLGFPAVFLAARSNSGFTERIEQIIHARRGVLVSFLLTGTSLTTWVTLLHKDRLPFIADEAVYARLLPPALLGALICLQLGMLFLVPHINKQAWKDLPSAVWKAGLILLGCFLAAGAFMSMTRLGFVFDNVGLSWGPPGTPITFAQVNLVFAVSLLLAFAWGILGVGVHRRWLSVRDAAVFLGLWGLAVVLWWNEPVSATHFNPPPMAPNYEYYPNSDALIFDRSSHHLLYGVGFSNQLIRRPLYVGMLALFHTLGGPGYEGTIFFQILILAFIPSLVYLLASRLSNRLAGLAAGGLILLREKNAIELSGRIATSNAKLMMSDMVAMLGVIAVVCVMVRALSGKERDIRLLGIAGACLGLTALVRAQALILLPILLVFLFLGERPLKYGLRESLFVMLGLALVMSPWVWRNWNLTGAFVLDDGGEEKLLARNYSQNPIEFPPPLPGETEKEYSARIKRGVVAYLLQHPSDAAFFVSNHFLRNLATSVVYIAPVYSIHAPADLVNWTPFWDEWDGTLDGGSRVPVFITLALVAFGVGAAQAKNPRAGWFPFVVFLVYSGGNALVRSSGWRFSLPVDWIVLVYFSIALSYLPSRIGLTIDSSETAQPAGAIPAGERRSLVESLVFCLLLLAGASVPAAERIVPAGDFSRFTDDAMDTLTRENVLTLPELETFLERQDAVLYSGIALYPRYVTPASRIYLAYAPTGYPFFHLWLINDGDHQVVLPLGASPQDFPHTATVSVLGCREDNYIMARVVILHTAPERILLRDDSLGSSCPLGMPK